MSDDYDGSDSNNTDGGDSSNTDGGDKGGSDHSSSGVGESDADDVTDTVTTETPDDPAEQELFSDSAQTELYNPGYDPKDYEEELLDNSFLDDLIGEDYDRGYDPAEYEDELLDFSFEEEPQEPSAEQPEEPGEPSEVIESTEVGTFTAEEVNESLKSVDPNYIAPYQPGTEVKELELQQDTTFVRYYDNKNSSLYGQWMMEEKDVRGLTPEQIRDKFALPQTPEHKCSVTVPKGTHVRCGVANEQKGWGKGQGKQYDLMGKKIGVFGKERKA